MKDIYELTEEEKNIENEIENFTTVKGNKRKDIEEIIDTAKKNKAISLRIANYDLEKIKERANREGIPYQTLITTILHKYVNNQLYDKNEVLKSIKLLKENAI